MLGTGSGSDQQEGTRQDYLSLPYNDPRRKALRGSEAKFGALYLAEADARDAAGGLLSGSLSGFLGLVGAAAGVALALSGGAIPGLIIGAIEGAIGGAALGTILGAAIDIRLRYLTPREWGAAAAVFGTSLPPRERIILTDLVGLGGRPFTVPASSLSALGAVLSPALLLSLYSNPQLFQGRILVNMGRSFGDPLSYTRDPYNVPGQLLMHELTHAWQIHHAGSIPLVLCEGLYNQASNSLGGKVYDVTDVKQWREYNLEQQGAIVDSWYAKGQKVTDKYYRYISANLRPGSIDANSNPVLGPTTTTTLVGRFGSRIP
jgi:hypothetical protein